MGDGARPERLAVNVPEKTSVQSYSQSSADVQKAVATKYGDNFLSTSLLISQSNVPSEFMKLVGDVSVKKDHCEESSQHYLYRFDESISQDDVLLCENATLDNQERSDIVNGLQRIIPECKPIGDNPHVYMHVLSLIHISAPKSRYAI